MDIVRRLWGKRVIRFLAVAITCTTLQEMLLLVLIRQYGVEKLQANGIAFFVSAQANFTLSYKLTWGDRKLDRTVRKKPLRTARLIVVRWVLFNIVAVAALIVNEAVFKGVTDHTHAPVVIASLIGVLVGAVVTFTVNNVVTFRSRTSSTPELVATSEQLPTREELFEATVGRTLAFFLPAYREAENLAHTVGVTLGYLRTLAFKEIRLIIVQDGSPDNTGIIANALARNFPEVVVCHHTENRGYGGALTTGFLAAAAARTSGDVPFDLYGFSDSDGQFKPESVGTLLVSHHKTGADLTVGRRTSRESQARALLGKAWHRYGKHAVGRGLVTVSDVDCGLKIGHVAALSEFVHQLFGRIAAISPELIARSTMAGHRVVECPVGYYSRKAGKSTGSNPRVMLISGMHILLVGIALRVERISGKSPRLARRPKGDVVEYDGSTEHAPWPPQTPLATLTARREAPTVASTPETGRDNVTWYVGAAAALLSIAAYVITVRYHASLLYGDAISHLEIARRMIDGTTPGLAQLGGVWPPLPHILELYLVWDNQYYYDGFAGSIVSMAAFVVTAVLIYKIVFNLTKNKIAGVVSAAIFALSANMLYMQSTPMTESLLFCMLTLTVYCLQQWADTGKYPWLAGAGLAAFLGTLTRYESWVVLGVQLPIIILIAMSVHLPGLDRKQRRGRALDRIILFVLHASLGIGIWMLWNAAIFGSPFAFQTGQYAKPSLWLTTHELAINNWRISFETYAYAVIDNVSWPVLLAAGLGVLCLLVEVAKKRIALRSAAPMLSLLVIWPFYVWSLHGGERPLHVWPIDPDLYNVRFGLVMLLPVAMLAGVFVSTLTRLTRRIRLLTFAIGTLAILGIAGLAGLTLHQHGPVTYREALGSQSPAVVVVTKEFKEHYTSGLVLAQSFGNEGIVFAIPSNELIYEGSFRLWPAALRSPSANHIRYMVVRCGSNPDQVCTDVNRGEYARYNLVWESRDKTYRIYEIKSRYLVLATRSQRG